MASNEVPVVEEFRLEDSHFNRVRVMLKERTGIALSDVKRAMVYSRLAKRLRTLGLDNFDDYLARVESDPEEETCFKNALTTNLTHFFREAHHFEFLKDTIVPEWRARRSGKPLRVWSAGCSTGMEPYSIAISLREAGLKPKSDYTILATDIDGDVLDKARARVYKLEDVDSLSLERKKNWFLKGTGGRAGSALVKPELATGIDFQILNFIEPWGVEARSLDVVFCRNALIYFERDLQTKLVTQFERVIVPDGYLLLGHSESIPDGLASLQNLGKTVFRKAGAS